MSEHKGMAQVIHLRTPVVTRPPAFPTFAEIGLDVARTKLQRHLLVVLLQHGVDGVDGHCYCGKKPRSMWRHMTDAVAAYTHLDPAFVVEMMGYHKGVVTLEYGTARCECGDDFSDHAPGREDHMAEVIAANVPADDVTRCLAAIRKAGRER